jgi:hypothetical protein
VKLHADMGNRDLRNPEEFMSSGDVLTAILSHSDSQAVVKHEGISMPVQSTAADVCFCEI